MRQTRGWDPSVCCERRDGRLSRDPRPSSADQLTPVPAASAVGVALHVAVQLVDANARCVDRHDTPGQLALLTEDADFVVYAESGNALPTKRIRGQVALAPSCDHVNACQATVHMNGQSITRVDGGRAWGVTYCLDYQVKDDGGAPSLVVTAVRYLDSFVKREGRWLIRQRQVMVAWTETRPLAGR